MSPYFSQMKASYQSEIDDLRFDSGGKDVLIARLAEKRRAFGELLPMIEIAPEMVAATFHGSITVHDRALMGTFVCESPGALPSWDVVSRALTVQADHDPLIMLAMRAEGGDQFLVTMACLQYLFDEGEEPFVADIAEELDPSDDEGDADGQEGAEKAEDWLSEHGFDRRSTS